MLNKYSQYIPRSCLAIIFIYHGLIPKLIFKSEQEVLMNDTLIPFIEKNTALIGSGIAEVIYGLLILILWKSKRIIYPAVIFSILVTIAILFMLPQLMTEAFNPFSLNLALLGLSLLTINYTKSTDINTTNPQAPRLEKQ